MDLIDKAGKGVGDLVAKAKERERVRLEDCLHLIDSLGESARQVAQLRKHRPGYNWDSASDKHAMEMIANVEAIDDADLRTVADELCAIQSPHEGRAPAAALDAAYRAVVKRLGQLRRDTLADD
jgi:hypothetical protein